MGERLTSYDVWEQILENHPEIDLVVPCPYSPEPHRKAGEPARPRTPSGARGYYPAENFPAVLNNWRAREPITENEVLGVGGIIGIGVAHLPLEPRQYYSLGWLLDITNNGQKWIWTHFECWEPVEDFEPRKKESFLFVDFEVPVSIEATTMVVQSVKKVEDHGYLLITDGSYHFVGDELSPVEELPARYGRLINAFAGNEPRWSWARAIGSALIGAKDRGAIREICDYITTMVGHSGKEAKKWFGIDLRHVAYSLLGFPVLRISGRKGYPGPPILVAEIY